MSLPDLPEEQPVLESLTKEEENEDEESLPDTLSVGSAWYKELGSGDELAGELALNKEEKHAQASEVLATQVS